MTKTLDKFDAALLKSYPNLGSLVSEMTGRIVIGLGEGDRLRKIVYSNALLTLNWNATVRRQKEIDEQNKREEEKLLKKKDEVRVDVAGPMSGQQLGKKLIQIHADTKCKGDSCPFHNPSKHHMRYWKTNVRLDRSSLVERICSHGVGHPDPDSVAYFVRAGIKYMGVHGCDGCCDPNQKK
jgi:hypothetical protein